MNMWTEESSPYRGSPPRQHQPEYTHPTFDKTPGITRASAVRRLKAVGLRCVYTGGERLYREGDRVDSIFVIESGLVKLVQHLANGRSRVVRLHSGGAVVGLNGLLQRDHAHTAIALGEVSVIRIRLVDVSRWCRDDPGFCVNLFEQLYGNLRDADLWITQFSTGDIRGRVARLLCFLMAPESGDESGVVEMLSCNDMAGILGVTPESVSRNVASFKRERLLRPLEPGSHRYLCDARRLQQIGLE